MIRSRAALAAICLVAITAPAAAQSMPGMDMSGVTTPKPPDKSEDTAAAKAKHPAKPTSSTAKQKGAAPKGAAIDDRNGMDHSAMPGMEMPAGTKPHAQDADHSSMPGMTNSPSAEAGSQQPMQSMPGMQIPGDSSGMAGMSTENAQQTGTALEAGDAPAPAVPTDHAADRAYPPQEMAMARHHLQEHHGGEDFYQVLLNVAEVQFHNSDDGYRWAGQAWFGGDLHRLFVKTEGEGAFHNGLESAEVQALYSRAIGPYFYLQAGARQDVGPSPKRTYATAGFEGLAPEFFEVEGAAFLSNTGDLLARLEGYYNQRITQRLVLQPRVELNFTAQNVRENKLGSGLSNAELGLRLRYEIRREFAPYLGVSWNRTFGDTAEFVRSDGGSVTSFSVVAGIRAWF